MENEVIAYKAFFKGLVNNIDGINYEVGMEYETNDKLQYTRGGFHMCEYPEDCFKYLKPRKADVDLTLVKGYGNMYSVDGSYALDDRLGKIFICEKMEILKVFSRQEVIEMGLSLKYDRLEKFIEEFPLTAEEAELFKEALQNEIFPYFRDRMIRSIDYYQKYNKGKVKQYGRNNY